MQPLGDFLWGFLAIITIKNKNVVAENTREGGHKIPNLDFFGLKYAQRH
jgi:hypothetical protein